MNLPIVLISKCGLDLIQHIRPWQVCVLEKMLQVWALYNLELTQILDIYVDRLLQRHTKTSTIELRTYAGTTTTDGTPKLVVYQLVLFILLPQASLAANHHSPAHQTSVTLPFSPLESSHLRWPMSSRSGVTPWVWPWQRHPGVLALGVGKLSVNGCKWCVPQRPHFFLLRYIDMIWYDILWYSIIICNWYICVFTMYIHISILYLWMYKSVCTHVSPCRSWFLWGRNWTERDSSTEPSTCTAMDNPRCEQERGACGTGNLPIVTIAIAWSSVFTWDAGLSADH